MTNLSLAAQAVLDAFIFDWLDEVTLTDRICLANALRAAASQVAPLDFQPCFLSKEFNTGLEVRNEVIHHQLLDIADELDNG